MDTSASMSSSVTSDGTDYTTEDMGSDTEEGTADETNSDTTKNPELVMPADTPEWEKQLLAVIRNDFGKISCQLNSLQTGHDNTTTKFKEVSKRVNEVEAEVLDIEYLQRRSNLVFTGIAEGENETDKDTDKKLRQVLRVFKDIESTDLKFERCHRLGSKRKHGERPILCCFSWFGHISLILKHRKQLPRGIYVNENLPDEWEDRRKVLKPLFNAAKRLSI